MCSASGCVPSKYMEILGGDDDKADDDKEKVDDAFRFV